MLYCSYLHYERRDMAMSDVYDDYASPQYLGKSGVTLSCLHAMAAILTGAFQPKKITVVIGQFGNESIMRVLFLVWDWFYPGITIISDGFGTHGGEGGAGFSTALGLIQFSNIPLLQAWVHDETAFDELAQGTLTEEMFEAVQAAQNYNWKFYPVAAVRKVRRGNQHVLEAKRADGHTIFDLRLP
jgi:hypothetical protein